MHDKVINGPTMMSYQQGDQSEFQHHRTYRTNRRSSVTRAGGIPAQEEDANVNQVDDRPSASAAELAPPDQQKPTKGWDDESDSSEDDEECVLATPPDKRARYGS
eukprot:9364030-Pyramimonas_sp.AAC.1